MSDTTRLACIVIGPESRGRNYGVLRRAGPPLGNDVSARLNDFALSLTGWALRRREAMSAMFPLTEAEDRFAVLRARLLGEGEQGPIAVAHVVIAPRDLLETLGWNPLSILNAISSPGEADFAERELEFTPPTARRSRSPGGADVPNVAWQDHVVDVGEGDPERALAILFAAIDPPAQRARITGWATTSLLASVGQFDPASIFRLVTHMGVEPLGRFAQTHVVARLDTRLADVDAPASWRMFSLLATLGRKPHATPLAAFVWQPSMADDSAVPVADAMLRQACFDLDPAGQARLIRVVAELALRQDELGAPLRAALGQVFAALVDGVGDETTAFYVQQVLKDADKEVATAIPGLIERAAAPGVLQWLGDDTNTLDGRAVADVWARLIDEPDWIDRLRGVSPGLIGRVLNACLNLAPGTPRSLDRLAAGLLRIHIGNMTTGRAPSSPAPIAALEALLRRGPETTQPDLLDPAVVNVAWTRKSVAKELILKVAGPALHDAETELGLAWAILACLEAKGRAA